MKQTCPKCGQDAVLHVAVTGRNKNIPDRSQSWKLTCSCGLEDTGEFSTAVKTAVMLLYLLPVGALWGIFLLYGRDIDPPLRRLVVWLVHMVPGVLIGDRISTRYAASVARKQFGKTDSD